MFSHTICMFPSLSRSRSLFLSYLTPQMQPDMDVLPAGDATALTVLKAVTALTVLTALTALTALP